MSCCLSHLNDFLSKNLCCVCLGEDKRIKEFYQSRGLERVIQPAGDGKSSFYSCICLHYTKRHYLESSALNANHAILTQLLSNNAVVLN